MILQKNLQASSKEVKPLYKLIQKVVFALLSLRIRMQTGLTNKTRLSDPQCIVRKAEGEHSDGVEPPPTSKVRVNMVNVFEVTLPDGSEIGIEVNEDPEEQLQARSEPIIFRNTTEFSDNQLA